MYIFSRKVRPHLKGHNTEGIAHVAGSGRCYRVYHIRRLSWSSQFSPATTRYIDSHPTLRFPSCRVGDNIHVAEASNTRSTAFIHQDVCLSGGARISCEMKIWDEWVVYRLEASMDNPKIGHVAQASSNIRQLLSGNVRGLMP